MNRVRKFLLLCLGERLYLSLLASVFQRIYPSGLLSKDYQDLYFIKALVREGDYCVDIGAHLGYFTVELSKRVKSSGRVWAIEPMSKFYLTLQALLKRKKISNVVLYQLAMGGDSPMVDMGIPKVGSMKKFAYARIMKSSAFLEFVETEQVKNERGDDLFADLNRLDFIKCDVEGLEVAVFAGMIHVIAKHLPTILCELADRQERIKLYEMLRFGFYDVYYLQDHQLHLLDVYSDRTTISHNHYFIPRSKRESLGSLISADTGSLT